MEVKVSWQFDFNDFAKFLTDLSCVSFVLFLKNEQVLCTQNLPLFDFQSGFIFFCAKQIISWWSHETDRFLGEKFLIGSQKVGGVRNR